MIEELCCGPSPVHLLHQVDSELHDADDESDVTNIIATHPQHHSLIRLESGRVIWWSDNGIKSNRLEVMLRRRMRYLQEEQKQRQQQEEVMMREEMRGEKYNDSANTDCGKISAEKISNVDVGAAALNEVSLESAEEQPSVPNQPLSHSNQDLLRHCRENNIPIVTVGCAALPYQKKKKKKIWLDFGEEDVNQVGTTSTQQFLIHASSTFSTSDALDTTLSTIPENDDPIRKNSSVNVTVQRISSKQGFICMLHDDDNSSPSNCENNHDETLLDPINLYMKDGDTQMIHVVWNPIQDGCVRENIELLVNIGGGGDQIIRHEIIFVGSARGIETGDKFSEDCSEIDENASQFDLVIDGVGLIVTDESIECSSVLTNGGENDVIEVHEIAQMMQSASISPKKATIAAQGLSHASENAEFSPKKQLDPNGIMAAHREIDSERMFAEESRLVTETSQDFVNGLYMNDKVKSLLDDFDAESSTGDERSGRSTPTFGSLSSEEVRSTLSNASQEPFDRQHLEPQFETIEEEITMDINEPDNSYEGVSPDESGKGAEKLMSTVKTVTSGQYDKVTTELNALMDTSVDLQSSSQSGDFNSSSPEEEDDQLQDEKIDTISEGLHIEENQQGADEVRDTSKAVTLDHYDNVTTELNALMDTSEDLHSQSQSEDFNSPSPEEEYDRIQDEKFGIFAFNESMSDDENKDLKILPETSMDRSSEFDSKEIDTTIDSEQKLNQYGELSSDLDDLMLEFSELEQFTLMQREYLLSPTAHDFQTQLENINEQIDSNLTPSPGNGIKSKIVTSNKAENISPPPSRAKEAKPASYTTTPKDSAQRCYFYRTPRIESNGQVKQCPSIQTQSIKRIQEKRTPYKSPVRTALEAETSFQTIDSLSEGLLSSHASIGTSTSNNKCDSADSSGGMLIESSSLDELSSGESEFDQSSAAIDDDTSTLLSPLSSEASSLSPSPIHRLERKKIRREISQETRSDQIAVMKSKLSSISSIKTSSNDKYERASNSNSKPSLTKNRQLKASPPMPRDVSSLTASASTEEKSNKQGYLSPSYDSSTISSTAKLQLETPSHKPLDIAAMTRSAVTAQRAARMTYGDFSKSPITENSPGDDRDATGMSWLQMKKSLSTPQSKRAPSQLKTPSSISAYEKHIERMRRSRSAKKFS